MTWDGSTCRRRNLVQAAYVDAAITLCKNGVQRQAENFLVREGLPNNVVSRVVLEHGPFRARPHHELAATEKK